VTDQLFPDFKPYKHAIILNVDEKGKFRSVMQGLWSVAELQGNIFSHYTSDSLSALARTWKALKDPALDSLWAHTPITPLLSLLRIRGPSVRTSFLDADERYEESDMRGKRL